MIELQGAVVSTRLASLRDGVPLGGHYQLRLGIVALGTEDEFADKSENLSENVKKIDCYIIR